MFANSKSIAILVNSYRHSGLMVPATLAIGNIQLINYLKHWKLFFLIRIYNLTVLFLQILGIPMGGNASPFIADLYLSWCEYCYVTKLTRTWMSYTGCWQSLLVMYWLLCLGCCFYFQPPPLDVFVHGFCFSNNGLNMLPWTSFTCYTKDNQQGCFRLSNWFSLRRFGAVDEPLAHCMIVHSSFGSHFKMRVGM